MTDTFSPDDTSAVTLEDLEAFLARNTRDILPSIVPGQNQVGGRFESGKSGIAPPPAHVEGSDGSSTAPAPSDGIPDDDDDDEADSGAEEDDDEGLEPVVETPAPVAVPDQTPPADDELIDVGNGVHMTRAAIQSALASRPAPIQSEEPTAAGSGVVTSAPAEAPVPSADTLPPIPQELLDDPEMGPVVRLLQAQQADLETTKQQLAFVSDIAVSRAQEELSARVTAGIHEFRDAKHLTEEQLIEINKVAANLNVMPSLASGIDPITGETIDRDPQRAAYRALEIAYWQMPQYREQELASQVSTRAKDQRRKQKLAGVMGGSGSVARTTQIPVDRRSRELAAVSELREMMSPGSEE